MKKNVDENIEEKEEEKEKKKGRGKKIALIIITIPILTFIILYFTNASVNTMGNNLFKGLPFIGKTFQAFPSKAEQEERKKILAEYYLSLDQSRTVDKLIILKKQDSKLYDDILLEMNKKDLATTKDILKEIRNKEIKKDILQREIDAMNKEKGNELKDIANYYLKLGLVGTINNLERDILDLKLDFKESAKVMENFKPDYAAKVIYYMDENMSSAIKENLSKSYAKQLEKEIKKYEETVREKENLATIYLNKKIEEAGKELQNKDTYSPQDLGLILINMDYLSAAKILSEFEDKEYVNVVLSEVKNLEQINKTKENMTGFSQEVNKALKVMALYKKDVETLKKSYEKMTSAQIVNLVNEMTTNKPKFRQYKIDETKNFTISEEELMIEILKTIKPKLLAQVISGLNSQKGAEISRKIGLPNVP